MLVYFSSFSVKDDCVSIKFPCSFYHNYIFSSISDFHFAVSESKLCITSFAVYPKDSHAQWYKAETSMPCEKRSMGST